MRVILLCFLLFTFNETFSMDAKSIIQKMNNKYASLKIYSLSLDYELYKGFTSSVVEESYQGEIYKSDKGYYQKINGNEFIYTSNYFLNINEPDKSIIIDGARDFQFSPIDFDLAIKECTEIAVEESKGSYIIKMTFKSTSNLPLSNLILEVNSKSFLLNSFDFYYSISQNFSKTGEKEDFDQAHLKIRVRKFDEKPIKKNEYFLLETYFLEKDKVLVPTGVYTNHTFIDIRKK